MYSNSLNLDFSHLAPNYNADVQVFTTANGNSIQNWTKPRGATMCYMICIGSGAGAGGGVTRATTVVGSGGGGGACSGIGTMMMPIMLLPDTLKVQVGAGGAGGAAGIAGGAGSNSYISLGAGLTALTAIPNVLLMANGSTQPGGGGAGVTGTGGAAGAVPSIGTDALCGGNTGVFGIRKFTVGQAGNAGGAGGSGGTSPSGIWNLLPLGPGTGGGGIAAATTQGQGGGSTSLQGNLDFADGTINAGGPLINGGSAGLGVPAGLANPGIYSIKPFVMTGGTGGGSANATVGADGGIGAIGSGGGGGGAGTTGGRGGNGGDGLVIIISW